MLQKATLLSDTAISNRGKLNDWSEPPFAGHSGQSTFPFITMPDRVGLSIDRCLIRPLFVTLAVTILEHIYGKIPEEREYRTAVSFFPFICCCLQIQPGRGADLPVRERCMNLMDTQGKSGSGAVVSGTANTRLSGLWLIVARTLWLVLVIPSLGLFVAGIPVYFQQLQTACVDLSACSVIGIQNASVLQELHTLGFSASGYAGFLTIFFVIVASIWTAVGFLIFWRRSDDWLALLAAFVLVMFNITYSSNLGYALALSHPVLALPLSFLDFLVQLSLGAFLLLFPNGRLGPRWMWLILLLVILNAGINSFPSPASPFNASWPVWLYLLVALIVNGSIIFSQIYRYRRISTPVQRQQTKWIVLDVTVTVGIFMALYTIDLLIPTIGNPDFWGLVIVTLVPGTLLLVPLSIGFSILRYRLYDIDVLINRALVYGTLTVSLALVYAALVISLQTVVHLFTRDVLQSPIVIVASTLAIAALFQPLRRRIQAIIDRRFYRRKYDAARTLEQFSVTLRNELELSQLSEQLIDVVQETMQPTHVSLWLRKSDQEKKTNIKL